MVFGGELYEFVEYEVGDFLLCEIEIDCLGGWVFVLL